MQREHKYFSKVKWTGNKGQGTSGYSSYDRSHIISANGKADILGSSDPAFRGNATMYSPEDLFVASLATCHMLWYLHLCSDAGVVVVEYHDNASGTMQETANGGGYFSEVTLYPAVTVAHSSMIEKANALHEKANKQCFIANSCNFPVYHKATCKALNS
jgi:organic hydroperoxide reductase OsmC/OhrA